MCSKTCLTVPTLLEMGIFQQLRSVPIMPTVTTLFCRRGTRQFPASGTAVEENFISGISKNTGRCRELKLLITIFSEVQHIRLGGKHSRVNFVGLGFTLRRFVTVSHCGLHCGEQVALRFPLRIVQEVSVEVDDVISNFGIQFHSMHRANDN